MSAPSTGFWFTDASVPTAEIVAKLGFDFVVLDVEHGMFDLAILERFIPALKGMGLDVYAKVLGPAREPIQQTLDFGCDGVIIPHVESAAHAAEVTAFSKFPPLGRRSLAGGRTTGWNPLTDAWIAEQNSTTRCFPLIEEGTAVDEIQQIAALPTVDGIQIGPTDLSTSRGRGAYGRTPADLEDFEKCIDAFDRAGKPWIFPAWTPFEQEWALSKRSPMILLGMQYYVMLGALTQAKESFDVLEAQQRLEATT
ncbi:aldolase/citrate lyase family protein [Arthrobacter ginkgonis]|uniref:Aldolase/citrate lyase family protein n=1 Tax=Arthrobacter ginkgonis TaxID=1630594 RepID=A0ABP7BSU2_9MICC